MFVMRINAKRCCLLLWAAACLAQNPAALFEKAPPDIDEALRARVMKFYQAHVEGKFRAADAFVAEDSKDAFFEADKIRCRGFDIMSVKYSDSFSRAVAVIACDTDFPMPMGRPMAVKMPVRSQWKTVDGQWFWYLDPVPEKEVVTPFGIRKPQNPQQPAAASAPRVAPMDIETVFKQVKTDKKEVSFDPASAGVNRVVVTNQMPGSISVSLEPAMLEGLDLKLDRTSLGQGQSAVLSIRYEPAKDRKPSAAVVRVVVSPLGLEIPIQIRFAAPVIRDSR
jgi:hypothetical protein